MPAARWAKSLLLLGLSSLVALLIAEGVLRLYESIWPTRYTQPSLYVEDYFTGSTHRAGASGWWTAEGRAHVRINSQTLRDQEHTLAKPGGVFRIAVLGDSYAEALQVPVEATFWHIMQTRLNQMACAPLVSREVEVINFGVAGYGTAQELLTLQHRALAYGPDMVLLAFVTGNDVRNNHKALEGSTERPYFTLEGKHLVLDDGFRAVLGMEENSLVNGVYQRQVAGWKQAWLLAERYFHLARMVHQAGNDAKSYLAHRDDPAPSAEAAPGVAMNGGTTAVAALEVGLDSQVYLPTPGIWAEAWQVTDALIAEINRLARSHQARFFLASLSSGAQVHPDPAARRLSAERLGVPDLLAPDRHLQAVAQAEGIPFEMLVPTLQRWAEQNGQCVHGFANAEPCGGHWNEHGHRIAGERLAERLCEVVATDPEPAVQG